MVPGLVAVAGIFVVARRPTILPGLTVRRAAAGHDTLVWVIVVMLAGGAILFPSLGLLFRLTLRRRLRAVERVEVTSRSTAAAGLRRPASPLLGRVPVACLVAGAALLNLADAGWAHAVGVACLPASS